MYFAALDQDALVYLALGLAALALIVAVLARKNARGWRTAIDEIRADSRRSTDASASEVDSRLDVLKKHVARMARGERVDPDQVMEGRMWRDASPAEAQKLVADGSVRVLDVRMPQETALGIIPGALILPVQELESRWREIDKRGKPLLVYCAGGARSAAACEFLGQQGFEALLNLDGGFQSWSGPRSKPG